MWDFIFAFTLSTVVAIIVGLAGAREYASPIAFVVFVALLLLFARSRRTDSGT